MTNKSICIKTPELSGVFNNVTNSYKLFWFYALLSLINRTSRSSFAFDEIICEMAVVAWHPKCFYRLTFGAQDKLQDVIIKIKNESGLPSNASQKNVRDYIDLSSNIKKDLLSLYRYVPTRFLTPWFTKELKGIPDGKRTKIIEKLAGNSQNSPSPCPYFFKMTTSPNCIFLNSSWHEFFINNMGISLSFVEYHLSKFLQGRNPNVPGIIEKLRAPTSRGLTNARKFWNEVRKQFIACSKGNRFIDIYSNNHIGSDFSIDHFLPWSFVNHNLLWNLTPVEKATNSKKSDVLPDMDKYLLPLASLHRDAIIVLKNKPKLLEDFTDVFKEDVRGLMLQSKENFINNYEELIKPQYQIAKNMGFASNWVYCNPTGCIE